MGDPDGGRPSSEVLSCFRGADDYGHTKSSVHVQHRRTAARGISHSVQRCPRTQRDLGESKRLGSRAWRHPCAGRDLSKCSASFHIERNIQRRVDDRACVRGGKSFQFNEFYASAARLPLDHLLPLWGTCRLRHSTIDRHRKRDRGECRRRFGESRASMRKCRG
jgi:hypothetical protein